MTAQKKILSLLMDSFLSNKKTWPNKKPGKNRALYNFHLGGISVFCKCADLQECFFRKP